MCVINSMGDEEKESARSEVRGGGGEVKARRQLLHAWKLGLFHPRTNAWMKFEVPVPVGFTARRYIAVPRTPLREDASCAME